MLDEKCIFSERAHFAIVETGGVNCSVSDTINALGGGQVNFETLTINVDNCGGVTSYPCKTVTINVDKRG